MDYLLTSSDVARLLGVAPSSVKRWTQSGLLPCVVTPGRHRRFTRAEVDAFAREHRSALSPAPAPSGGLATLLLSEQPIFAVHGELLAVRARAGSWHAAADELSHVLQDLGERWAVGQITILQEHRASERLARALSTVSDALVVAPGARTALLAAAEGDDHTLALQLAELCTRAAGWNVVWGGRSMPGEEIARRVAQGGIDVVGLSASVFSSDARSLAAQVERLAPVCADAGTLLVLGGSGEWPAALRGAAKPDAGPAARGGAVTSAPFQRVRRFAELHALLSGSAR